MESCCLAFFATLFADRHGTILSLDPQSTVSSMVLSLYSGFNRYIPFQSSQTVQQNADLNAIPHHMLPSSPQSLSSLQTVVRFSFSIFTPQLYSITLSKPLPPYPAEDPIYAFQIERDYDLPSIYASIDKAEALLRKSVLSPALKKSIPTEKSLYLLSMCGFGLRVVVPRCCFPTCIIATWTENRSIGFIAVC